MVKEKRKAPAEQPSKPVRHQLGPVFSDPDIVDRIFDYIVEQFPEMRAEQVEDLKRTTREEFRGAEYYIPQQSPTERQKLVEDVLRMFNGRNATEIARALQISRATVYRWVKQPAK
jgi:Mor family transcriptional regulator